MALFHRNSVTTKPYKNPETGKKQQFRRDVVVASATLVNSKQIRRSTQRMEWQQEAWAFWDTCGELNAVTRFVGNSMSRVRLFIAESSNDGGGEPPPAENVPDEVQALLDEMFGGSTGQGEMMRRYAMNMDIVGEVFFVRIPKTIDPSADNTGPEYRWIVASIDEFSYSGGHSRLRLPEDGTSIKLDPDEVTIIRLWTPHPRVAWQASSSVRANLPVLREIQALSQHITATIESRLAGAGLLAIPKSATLPNPNIQEGGAALHHNQFVDALVEGMVTPISDRDNASAVVPLVLSVDDESIGKIQHIAFWSELSSQVTEMREAAIRRFAAGAELPQEILLGLGGSSHWNASEIEEMAIKVAIEPIAATLCDALTQQYLWPALKAMGENDPEKWIISYSTSELSQRPDRSAEAQDLYDKGVLSPEALLRENGFNTNDLPDDDAQRREFARQVVLAKPELIAPLAPFVGFEGMEEVFADAIKPAPESAPLPVPGSETERIAQQAGATGAQAAAQQPGTQPAERPDPKQQTPRTAPARQPVTASATRMDHNGDIQWQLATIELVAMRALELAGKRMLTNSSRGIRGRPEAQAVHAWDLHTVVPEPPANVDRLLNNAFDLSGFVLGDQPCIQDAIETYCRALIASGRPHRKEYLVEALQHSGCLTPLEPVAA